jgi:membrane-associated protease RseP (regulator of RpoE activity)
VEKLEAIKQTKIFSAGISANFIAMLVFFALMILVFYLVLPKITSSGVFVSGTIKGYPAYNAIAPGTQVFSWNNKSISTIAQLENASQNDTVGSKVDIGTSNGTFVFTAIQQINSTSKRGLVGVNMYQKESVASGAGAQAWYFLFTLFALSFMLNFLVGVVNLLPIPGFDGWRIYKTNIKSAKIVNLLAALVLIMILVNALQWLAYA